MLVTNILEESLLSSCAAIIFVIFDMEPPIRILRRPCHITSDNPEMPSRPPVATKSLEQREADYAAARMRIMGSATPKTVDLKTNKISGSEFVNTEELLTKVSVGHSLDSTVVPTNTQLTDSTVDCLTSESCFNQASIVPNGILSNAIQNNRNSLAVVNVGRKLQHAQSSSKGLRQTIQSQQQRSLTASASSPSFFHNSNRNSQNLLLTFPVGYNNTGLLPTPPGFQYGVQNSSYVGLNQSQTAALTLMQQFSLLQQQYQHTLNGIQNQLITSGTHSSANFSPLNFPSSLSQPAINHKFTYPPTFN